MIELINVNKSYTRKGPLVLSNINLKLIPGEVIVILGHNGAGKTTLFWIINGMLKYNSGEILYWGKKYRYPDPGIKSKLGLVTENMKLYKKLTVKETIDFFSGIRAHKGVFNSEELTELFELKKYLGAKVNELSTGYYRRLFIMCSLLADIKLLFLDEPETSLDPISRLKVIEIIKLIKEKGIGVIAATHDLNFAEKIAERIVLIKEGQVLFNGPIKDFMSRLPVAEKILIKVNENPGIKLNGFDYLKNDGAYILDNSSIILKEFFEYLDKNNLQVKDINIQKADISEIYKGFFDK